MANLRRIINVVSVKEFEFAAYEWEREKRNWVWTRERESIAKKKEIKGEKTIVANVTR